MRKRFLLWEFVVLFLFLSACSSESPQGSEFLPESVPLSASIEVSASSREPLVVPEEIQKAAEASADARGQKMLDNQSRDKDKNITDYRILRVEVYEISENQDAFCYFSEIAVKPENENSPFWWAGNTQAGTGELEGYLLLGRQTLVQKIDGVWTNQSSGTGGISLK